MLSQSIQETARLLEDARRENTEITPDMHAQLISIMHKWQAVAVFLEGSARPQAVSDTAPFRPALVAGTDVATQREVRADV